MAFLDWTKERPAPRQGTAQRPKPSWQKPRQDEQYTPVAQMSEAERAKAREFGGGISRPTRYFLPGGHPRPSRAQETTGGGPQRRKRRICEREKDIAIQGFCEPPYACRDAFMSRYISRSISLSSPIACATISGVIACVWPEGSSSHRGSTRRTRFIQASACPFVAFAGNAEKIAVTFSPDMEHPFAKRVLALGYYSNQPVAMILRYGGMATDGCPNITMATTGNARVENYPASLRVAPRKSGNDVELAEGPKIPGSEFRKRDDDRSVLDAVLDSLNCRRAAIKNTARKRKTEWGAAATSGRRNLASAARRARNLKHCLGDMSIRIYASFFSALSSQVLVALIFSSYYVPPFKKRKPGRLP
jgi:hypothetical protein